MKKYYYFPYIPIVGLFSMFIDTDEICICEDKHFFLSGIVQGISGFIIISGLIIFT